MTESLTNSIISATRPVIEPAVAAITQNSCTIRIGTCGYSYTEWVDSGFYTPSTKNSEMLSQYAHHFEIVELNYTWYQMARADAISRLVDKAPANFRFAAKLTRTMTHERSNNLHEQLALYKKGIAPLLPQLIAILIQLPPDFDRSIDNRKYLAELLDGLSQYPLAIEFRNSSWATDSVFAELEKRKVSLVTVDSPELATLFPTLDVVTNPNLFYMRFHGRNSLGWTSGNMQKKFDYDYSKNEFAEWYANSLSPMLSKCANGVIFFNNHVKGQAPRNAQLLSKIISSSN